MSECGDDAVDCKDEEFRLACWLGDFVDGCSSYEVVSLGLIGLTYMRVMLAVKS